MFQFEMPESFEGVQFLAELDAAGIVINSDTSPLLDADGNLWLGINESDVAAAQEVLDSHIPLPPAAPTIEERLESAGLSIDELREVLGLE